MDIDATLPWDLKRGGRQDQAVCDDYQNVEFQATQNLKQLLRLERGRLIHAEPAQSCEGFDRACVQWLTAAGRPVRLGEHGADPVCLRQGLECRDGESRRAGETQP